MVTARQTDRAPSRVVSSGGPTLPHHGGRGKLACPVNGCDTFITPSHSAVGALDNAHLLASTGRTLFTAIMKRPNLPFLLCKLFPLPPSYSMQVMSHADHYHSHSQSCACFSPVRLRRIAPSTMIRQKRRRSRGTATQWSMSGSWWMDKRWNSS